MAAGAGAAAAAVAAGAAAAVLGAEAAAGAGADAAGSEALHGIQKLKSLIRIFSILELNSGARSMTMTSSKDMIAMHMNLRRSCWLA